jgi:hypothetical protein
MRKGRVAMSNNYQEWEDEDFDLEEEETVQPTRGNDLVKQLRKAQKEAEKKAKALEAELNSLRSVQRESSITRILEAEGINSKIAKFIPAEVSDAEAIRAWLDENGEVFGYRKEVPEQRQPMSDDDVNAWRNMTDVLEDALPYDNGDNQYNMIRNAQSAEDLLRMIYGDQ